MLIEGHSAIEGARLKAEAEEILANSDLEATQLTRNSEIQYLRLQNELEIQRTSQLAGIEVSSMVGNSSLS